MLLGEGSRRIEVLLVLRAWRVVLASWEELSASRLHPRAFPVILEHTV